MTIDLQQWSKPLNAYANWIGVHNLEAGEMWSRRLNSADVEKVEGAVAEAVMWDFLSSRSESVRLNETPGGGGVDFEFTAKGSRFLVEVTNISSEAASRASGMPNLALHNGFYGLLTAQIRQKVRRKLTQALNESVCPVLVAVTTLHYNASCLCCDRRAVEYAMGSPPQITFKLNLGTGETQGEPYESTDLRQSVFLSPSPILDADGSPIVQAKYEPISGFLLGGFGLDQRNVVRVFGGLNPEAIRPFDTSLLPDIPFCSFAEWPAATRIGFKWTITKKEEEEREAEARERRLRAAGYGELLDAVRKHASRDD